MKRFFNYLEEIRKQKKLTKTGTYLSVFSVLLFLSLALTLPNYLLKQQQILRGQAAGQQAEEEFVGPFPSWANVKTAYSAVGDGVADDTAKLQTALNDLGTAGHSSVLYLPAGTYKITGALNLKYRIDVSIIGADPATTKIKWAGSSGGTMVRINGVAYSKFDRITFDGSGTAGVVVDQSYDNLGGYFDTGNEYADDVFMDVGTGIQGGALGYGFSEISVMRSTFLRNTGAGIHLWNFNALDVWVWNSVFQDCGRGLTNNPGAGNFKVYNSLFKNSTVADMEINNTGGFSARNNTSLNSQMFFYGGTTGNPATITLQGNTILDPVSTAAISIGDQGPVMLLDNTIRSRSGASGAAVEMRLADSDLTVVGNTFTVSSPISTGGRLISIDNTTVPLSNLSGLGEPTLPSTPPSMNRQVFEVPVGASAATIQTAINNAASAGNRSVVHIPAGNYNITATVSIPANSDVQLVGDGYSDTGAFGTLLKWGGSSLGPVIKINGPTKATLRDLGVNGNWVADGIQADNLDQSGSRVFMHQAELRRATQNDLLVDGLDYTHVDIRNFGSTYMTSGVGVKVVGGPLANAGTPAGGRTNIFSGSGGSNAPDFTVTNGSKLLVRDWWAEQGISAFADLSGKGTFTLDNALVAKPINQTPPAIAVTGFNGKATVLETSLWDRIVISGDGSQAKVMALGLVGGNSTGAVSNSLINNSSPLADARLLNSRQVPAGGGSVQKANIGVTDPTYIKDMIAHMRGEVPQILTALPAGVTDLRMFRVWVEAPSVGIHLLGCTGSCPSSTPSPTSPINPTPTPTPLQNPTPPPSTGPIGWWKLDDGSGTAAADASGSNNTGTLVNGPTWTTGKINGALSFDGLDDYVNIGDKDTYDFGVNQDFTVSAWVKTAVNPLTDIYPAIVTKGGGGSGNEFAIYANGAQYGAGWFFDFYQNGTQYALSGRSDITDGTWHHVVAQRQGSTLYTYEDGTLANTKAAVSGSIANSQSLRINGDASWNRLAGTIDDVRIYNRALSASEVQSVYTNTGPTPLPTAQPTPTRTPTPTFTPTPTPLRDTILPTVAITSPANGSTVARNTNITVSATATDNVGVTQVQFFRNGSRVCTDTTVPYSCAMSTDDKKNRTVTYTAQAFDAAGNSNSANVSVKTN